MAIRVDEIDGFFADEQDTANEVAGFPRPTRVQFARTAREPPPMQSLVERGKAMRARPAVRRLATGLQTFDKACRGGLAVPRLVIVGGAPGAGKTALVVWLALLWARQGITVLVLAVDEAADDILMRIAVESGHDVQLLEARDADEWRSFERVLAELPLLLVDGDDGWTIEDAAALLSQKANGAPAVLMVDSIQTVTTKAAAHAESRREQVDAVVGALKQVVKARAFLVMATSELARGAYRSRSNAEHINDLAAFKESGGVEYGAETALLLRSSATDEGRVDVAVPKNRGGRKLPFCIEIDHRTRIREVEAQEAPDRDERAREQVCDDAIIVLRVIANKPGLHGKTELRTAVRATGASIGNDRIDAALERLCDDGRVENRGTRSRPELYAKAVGGQS